MKSATAVCAPQRSSADRVHGGATSKQRRSDDHEVQAYLSKLRQLLPAQPTNRRLSKLEVIQSVIEYICDLQYCLQMPLESADAVQSEAATSGSDATCPQAQSCTMRSDASSTPSASHAVTTTASQDAATLSVAC